MPAEAFLGLLPLMGAVFLFYVIKLLVDARTRNKLISSGRPDEEIRAFLAAEARLRRRASLRWTVLLASLAVGFALIALLGLEVGERVSLAAIAILLGATAVGNFVFYTIERRALAGDARGEPPAQS